MRPLRPNSRGAVVPTPSRIGTHRPEHPFSRPSTALSRLDKVREGASPSILIIRSRGGIGDVLMTTPTVRSVAKKYNCKVDYCTDYSYLDGALEKVVRGIPYIGKVFDIEELQAHQEEYDAVINLTCPCTSHEKPLAPPVNRIDLFANHAAIKLDSPKMDYVMLNEDIEEARAYLSNMNLLQYKLVLVQPSSSHEARDAPFIRVKEAMAALSQRDKNIVFLVITHNSDNVKVPWELYHTHVLQNFDIRQIAAIMFHCDLVLCPDSAILHMASALSKKTCTIFGPTDPRARVNYHPEAVAIWPGKELKNYPCWYSDPKDGYMCWKRLESEVIVEVCFSLLNNSPLPASRDLVTYGSYRHVSSDYEII